MQGESMIETRAGIDAAPMWAPGTLAHSGSGELDWQAVDRALRGIARRRATLDADEARWLREAERLEIWRPLGMVSALDYLERALGYAPRTAQDRLRVARALGALPGLSAALAGGELAFSAVRELTRVATPATEAVWLRAARGKTLRQVEEMVADRRPGDRPDDPPDPRARMHVVRFELSAETFARLRQARVVLDREHGRWLGDDPFVAALCGAVLDGTPAGEPSGRARFQVAMTVCARCRHGWQEGGGAQIPVGAAAVERAMCDAQHIGSIDGDAPQRAYQDIPPSVARLVWRRDGGRCRVPGCRSARGLELHHLVHRADGGSHDASNLVLACSACHQAHHAGTLMITGTADCLEVRRPAHAAVEVEGAHVGARAPAGTGNAAGTTSDRVGVANTAAGRDATPTNALTADTVDSRSPAHASIKIERAHMGERAAAGADGATGTTSSAPMGVANAARGWNATPTNPSPTNPSPTNPSPTNVVDSRSTARVATEVERAHVDARALPATPSDTADSRSPARAVAEVMPTAGPTRGGDAAVSRHVIAATAPMGVSGERDLDFATRRVQTKDALRALGWSSSIARPPRRPWLPRSTVMRRSSNGSTRRSVVAQSRSSPSDRRADEQIGSSRR